MSSTPSTQACSPRYAKRIDELLLHKSLAPQQLENLHQHLHGCEACQRRYNRVALAERLLTGGPDAVASPSQAELDRVRERVLQRARLSPEPPPRRSAVRWIGALVAIGAALAIALPLVLGTHDSPTAEPQFQTRGGAHPAEAATVGLRAFCAERGADGQRGLRELSPERPQRCPLGARLSFAYTNRSALRRLLIVGVDASLRAHWYLPRGAGPGVEIAADAIDEPLPDAIALDERHHAGALRVFALFGAAPLTTAAVDRAISSLRASKPSIETLERLPLAHTEQRSLLVQLK